MMSKEEFIAMRKQFNMTQQKFGEMIGLAYRSARQQVCEIEKGRTGVKGSMEKLIRLLVKERQK